MLVQGWLMWKQLGTNAVVVDKEARLSGAAEMHSHARLMQLYGKQKANDTERYQKDKPKKMKERNKERKKERKIEKNRKERKKQTNKQRKKERKRCFPVLIFI